MWNFSFRPQYTDDADIRYVEVSSNAPGTTVGGILEHFTVEHFAFYNNVGRTEVPPVPTDPEATGPGIRYRFGAYPFLEPQELHGAGHYPAAQSRSDGQCLVHPPGPCPPQPRRGTLRRDRDAWGRGLPELGQQPRPGLVFRFLGQDRNLRLQAPRH